uniref:Interferon lambda 1 n=1 Tax=Balaenoptera musculus TaxID=9771 RepID=A0A8C0E4N4_BALMU
MAADLMLVLVTTMGLGLARACPVPTTTRKGCGIGMFKSLLPSELVAFKKAKDGNSLAKDWNCSSRLFPRTRDLKQLQVSWESQARLVLGTVANSSLDHILDQPLHTLHHIHSKFQACVTLSHTPPSSAPGPRSCFQYWLHRLQEAPEKEFQDGLKASVTFILFHLLTWDLNCAARGDLCICELGPTPAHLGAQTLFMH